MSGGPSRPSGRIIFLNGTSSSGKSSLARALQAALAEPFWHFSFDHLRDSGALPMDRIRRGELDWAAMRPAVFDGLHRSFGAFAGAGNNLIIEHIVENEGWLHDLVRLLAGFDVFYVGVHCPLPELERRERARGDRRPGEAQADLENDIHQYASYDFEVDTTRPLADNVAAVIAAWEERQRPSVFDRLAESLGVEE